MSSENSNENKNSGIKRRDWLKGLATLPVFGGLAWSALSKWNSDHEKKSQVLKELGISDIQIDDASAVSKSKSDLIRVGIVGFGHRGRFQARQLGYVDPKWIAYAKKNNILQDWLDQEDLNVAITGICDVFEDHAQLGLMASDCEYKSSRIKARQYKDYREMLASDDIDAVIITTPDFHHAPMSILAAQAGKHVYCEKCMTRTEEEVYDVSKAVNENNIIYQLGHQYHQNSSYVQAKEVIRKNILGKITLVQTTSNRNTSHGAWVRHLDASGKPRPGSPESIDWDLFLGHSPNVPFSIDRYYNWTKWWDYATGLSGQLMSHEIDTANQLLGLGIPHSCVASGGIYFHKDNREIPDIFHATFEYPGQELTFMYSASLASDRDRGRLFLGHDASMNLGNQLEITINPNSTRYKDQIKRGVFDLSQPAVAYNPGKNKIDAITSASEKFYASRGLYYTYRAGKRVDTTFLHLKEWLSAIRHGTPVSVPIEKAVEVTIACHMATKSYREKRRVTWDPERFRIV